VVCPHCVNWRSPLKTRLRWPAFIYKDVFELEQIAEKEKAESLVKIEKHEVSYE
jgi:hypothetical protein